MKSHWSRKLYSGLFVAVTGCSLIVDSKLELGFGSTCTTDSECQGEGAVCTRLNDDASKPGLCSVGCSSPSDCPNGSVCSTGKLCLPKLEVGAILIGNKGEGWTKTHNDGLEQARDNLGYVGVEAVENTPPGQSTREAISKFVQSGKKVIYATSISYNDDIASVSSQYPDVEFFVCEGFQVKENVSTYYGGREQAWYLAGQVAASQTLSDMREYPDAGIEMRLGIISSLVGPDTVRNVNAFLLGARSVNSNFKVEVRWSGFFLDVNNTKFGDAPTDKFRGSTGLCSGGNKCTIDEYLADKLIAGGAHVIAHQSDVDQTNVFVQRYNGGRPKPLVYSVANNNQYGCQVGGKKPAPGQESDLIGACLGSVYWNWAPYYTDVLSKIRFNSWTANSYLENISDSVNSMVGFQLTNLGTVAIGDYQFHNELGRLAGDPMLPFTAKDDKLVVNKDADPTITDGYRKAGDLQQGQKLTIDELLGMCWFFDGVIEAKNDDCARNPWWKDDQTETSTPTERDDTCFKPARVPVGDSHPWSAIYPPGEEANGNNAFSCYAHGGKVF